MSSVTMVTLRPGHWTRIPGTRCEIRWDGSGEITVHRCGLVWDLSPLSRRPGQVAAWARIARAGRAPTPAWPIVPLAAPATYRSANRP